MERGAILRKDDGRPRELLPGRAISGATAGGRLAALRMCPHAEPGVGGRRRRRRRGGGGAGGAEERLGGLRRHVEGVHRRRGSTWRRQSTSPAWAGSVGRRSRDGVGAGGE
jgi:hypothetical protein